MSDHQTVEGRDDFRSSRAYFAAEPVGGGGDRHTHENTPSFRKLSRKRYLMTLALIAGTSATVFMLLE